MSKNEKLKKIIRSEAEACKRITNKDLVCKDCLMRYDDSVIYGNTSICEVYESKPNKILLGGECNEYVKE